MYHFTYITASKNNFYVGRHSTSNLNDNYKGSGKWVKVCIKKGVELHRKILYFYSTFEELILAEKELIDEHFDNPKNMNFLLSSSGFAPGELNPSKSDKERQRRSKFNWMKTKDGRSWFSENNPSKKESVKKLRSEFLKNKWKSEEYRKHMSKNRTLRCGNESNFTKNNPMKSDYCKAKTSARVRKEVELGLHNSQIKIGCIFCKKIVSTSNFARWHKKCTEIK